MPATGDGKRVKDTVSNNYLLSLTEIQIKDKVMTLIGQGQAMYGLKECEPAEQQRVRPGNDPSHVLFL